MYKSEGVTVNDAQIKVQWYKSSLGAMMLSPTLHVTNVQEETELSALRELFAKHAEVENIRFGRHPGTAYVDFRSAEDASSVMDAHMASPLAFDQVPLGLQFAAPSVGNKYVRPAAAPAELHPPHRKIFATRFGKPVSEELLRRVFRSYGEIISVAINYYADSSRNLAFIEFATVEEACKAVEAWKAGKLAALGSLLRMDFWRPPVEHPPHHTLRIEGYSGGKKATEEIAERLSPFVWKTFYPPGAMREGKGSTVAFLEFDTTSHAAAALERLREMKVNGDEQIVASYAPQPKGWRAVGGVQGRDFGGEKFGYGLTTGDKSARLDAETQLFRDVHRRDQWGRLERIAKYLGEDWQPSNSPEVKSLVQNLAKRRAETVNAAQANPVTPQANPIIPQAKPEILLLPRKSKS
ncbi:RNA-binding domain-containing protein [Phanerochaete sordida]|uniref:RNA-binding domain-containing protein n=1 Tax=Phanerochaete sordida TaxID=48140 RepID=A0A9P3GIK7_9APHY|nr:RNA-binding domain-containing protein [Phanerochaete sordida]